MSKINGSCLCGNVSYEFDLPAIMLNHCHCSRCRKASGAAFGSYVHAAKNRFRWHCNEDAITNYVPQVGDPRPFCSKCGSRVPLVEDDGVIIPAGTLDDDPMVKPCVNIHTNSKASWFDISDGIPVFDAEPPESFWTPIEADYESRLSSEDK